MGFDMLLLLFKMIIFKDQTLEEICSSGAQIPYSKNEIESAQPPRKQVYQGECLYVRNASYENDIVDIFEFTEIYVL